MGGKEITKGVYRHTIKLGGLYEIRRTFILKINVMTEKTILKALNNHINTVYGSYS